MTISYSWTLSTIKKRNEGLYPNAVVQTYWTKTGTDEDGVSGSFSGTTSFTTATMTPEQQFIPFEELTDEIILGWVKDVVVDDYEEHVNNKIAEQIALKKI
jgi:hypothetical protein